MKDNYTHITLVLDRSGSMISTKSDTIGGFNQFIKSQKEVPGKATFSFIQFDHEYENKCWFSDINTIAELTDRNYVPRGSTALYDAIGRTIIDTGDHLSKMPEHERPGRVLFVIQTDGFENASKEFRSHRIKEIISHQRDQYAWTFMFLGANQDAILTAGDLGIDAGTTLTYAANSVGTAALYGAMTRAVEGYRISGKCAYDNADRQAQVAAGAVT